VHLLCKTNFVKGKDWRIQFKTGILVSPNRRR